MKTINVELSKNENIINSHIILKDIFFKDNISLFNERNNEKNAVIINLKNTKKIYLTFNFNWWKYCFIFINIFLLINISKKYVKKSIIIKK